MISEDSLISVSPELDNKDLPNALITHAAHKVFAAWTIFQSLVVTSVGAAVDASTQSTPGGSLDLLSND